MNYVKSRVFGLRWHNFLASYVYIRSTFMYKHRLRLYFSLKLVIMMSTSSMSKGRDNIVNVCMFLFYRLLSLSLSLSLSSSVLSQWCAIRLSLSRFSLIHRNDSRQRKTIFVLCRFISVAVCERISYNQISCENVPLGTHAIPYIVIFNDILCELNETFASAKSIFV